MKARVKVFTPDAAITALRSWSCARLMSMYGANTGLTVLVLACAAVLTAVPADCADSPSTSSAATEKL